MKTAADTWPARLAEAHPQRSAALEELRGILLRGLRAGLSGRAKADGAFLEDITQEALVRILDRLHTFRGRSRFTSWALSLTLRLAFNELRRREWRHVSLEELQAERGTLPEEADPSLLPDGETERQELAGLVRRMIETELTPRQRDVLACELSGMPQAEIADQLGTSRNNVYKLFHDARKALKRALEAHGYDGQTLLSGLDKKARS